MQSYELPLPSA